MDEKTMDVTEGTASGEAGAGVNEPPEPGVMALFGDLQTAELAVHDLRRAGFDAKRLSILGREHYTEERPLGFYTQGDTLKVRGTGGPFWGGMVGLLPSPALLFIPSVGHVIVLGPLTAALVGALGGGAAAGGASALAAGLHGAGIPRDSVLRYEAAVRAHMLLLIVHGARFDAGRAMQILKDAGAESVRTHGI